ncbi:MAG: PAS domain-containing protein [Bryobacterales bacterium]|nr:PAS domain-containing protein [Bryobacterales bacterium]
MSLASDQAPDLVSIENRQLRARICELEAELAIAKSSSPELEALIQNVTERRQLEERLRCTQTALARHAAEFEALFRALPVGVGVSWDPSCRDIRINPAFGKILGVADEENASKSRQDGDALPFRVFKEGREVPAEELPMQVAARTGREVRDFCYELVRHDGVTLTEYGHATPLFDENGAVSGSIGVFLDFTELHRAQRELERANEELRRSNADLNHFAYGATHDLREPLRAIRIYSQLLARNVKLHSDPDLLECVNAIGDSAARMDRLLRDLMDYIQVATRYDQRTEHVDLNSVLRGVLSNLELSINESGAEISCPTLPTVPGHPAHYTHLFQNLIGNAIKYRSEDRPPRVQITVTQAEGVWKFAIADNGIGIEPNYTARVFDLFQRLHGREIPGSGMGLAICQRVVQRHGGRIWVESTPGVGSTFYFTLPVDGADRAD